MDGQPLPISSHDLYARLGTASAPLLVDMRRPETFAADNKRIAGAGQRPSDEVGRWVIDLPFGHPVMTYCHL